MGSSHERTTASEDEAIPSISDSSTLLQLGICKVPIPSNILKESSRWAKELTQLTPMIMAAQGDSEYAFYRNIMEEPELHFPLDSILVEDIEDSLQNYFGVDPKELRLDDAFVVHYNMEQADSSGAKHMDPSDITINMCIEKSETVQGSEVLFYGSQPLKSVEETKLSPNHGFRVVQEEGFATVHYGCHPHETLSMTKGGKRTNIVLTYCYLDKSRSDVQKRNCYFV